MQHFTSTGEKIINWNNFECAWRLPTKRTSQLAKLHSHDPFFFLKVICVAFTRTRKLKLDRSVISKRTMLVFITRCSITFWPVLIPNIKTPWKSDNSENDFYLWGFSIIVRTTSTTWKEFHMYPPHICLQETFYYFILAFLAKERNKQQC